MRKYFWKMFPPFKVRLTLEEIERFFGEDQLCGSVIKPRAAALAKDAERTVYSVRIDRMKPDQLALILISNVIGEELKSGAHHVYRGVLSMIGIDMRAVATRSTQLAVTTQGTARLRLAWRTGWNEKGRRRVMISQGWGLK